MSVAYLLWEAAMFFFLLKKNMCVLQPLEPGARNLSEFRPALSHSVNFTRLQRIFTINLGYQKTHCLQMARIFLDLNLEKRFQIMKFWEIIVLGQGGVFICCGSFISSCASFMNSAHFFSKILSVCALNSICSPLKSYCRFQLLHVRLKVYR